MYGFQKPKTVFTYVFFGVQCFQKLTVILHKELLCTVFLTRFATLYKTQTTVPILCKLFNIHICIAAANVHKQNFLRILGTRALTVEKDQRCPVCMCASLFKAQILCKCDIGNVYANLSTSNIILMLHIALYCKSVKSFMILGAPLHNVDELPVLKNDAAAYLYNFLLTYVTDIFSLCDNNSLEEVSTMISDTWPNIAVAISLMRQVMSHSVECVQDDIIKSVTANSCIFKALFLAFQVGPLNGKMIFWTCIIVQEL